MKPSGETKLAKLPVKGLLAAKDLANLVCEHTISSIDLFFWKEPLIVIYP